MLKKLRLMHWFDKVTLKQIVLMICPIVPEASQFSSSFFPYFCNVNY